MSNKKQRKPPEVPCNLKIEVDRLSNLPGHVIDKILSHLSLMDAVRTSVLSRKWRYKWVTLPYLVFDNQSVVVSTKDQTIVRYKLVNIVDHVLLLHTGPIHKFKLSLRDLQGVTDIDRWILFLSRGSVKELILQTWEDDLYKLPASIYSCQELIHLELCNCILPNPSTFEGFKSLKNLDLQDIVMEQWVLQDVISNCPLLERLTLINFDDLAHFDICAPNLRFFELGAAFEDVSFQNTFHLAVVSIGLCANIGSECDLYCGSTGNLIKFFAYLPHIQRLEVQSYFLKYLAAGTVPGKLPTPCLDLSFLSIHINFNDKKESLAALCLLRSSPNLQELEMLVRVDQQGTVQVDANIMEHCQNFLLNQLRHIKIFGISGIKQELSFINFLLVNSPVLERMTVKPATKDAGLELVKELLRFRRASAFAEIVYLDPVVHRMLE